MTAARSCATIAIFSAIHWRKSASARSFSKHFHVRRFPYIATLLHHAGETRASIPGLVIAGFAIGGALYGVFVSRLLPRLGETRMMRVGGLRWAFVSSYRPRPALAFRGRQFRLLGLSFYMLHGVIQIYASELAPAARGSAMALHSFFYFLGQAAGLIIYGSGLEIGIRAVCWWELAFCRRTA